MIAARFFAACTLAGAALSAEAGVPSAGPRPNEYPDVIVSEIGSGMTRYGTYNGISAYAFATVSCNVGYHDAIWIAGGQHQNQHPVITQSMYRIVNGRCEQIGMAWLKHGFCAADAYDCINLVDQSAWTSTRGELPILDDPQPIFAPRDNISCNWLGLFKTDTYSASLNSQQTNLGPRSEVNPWSGEYPYPTILEANVSGSCINKRLQVANTDMMNAPGQPYEGASYFIESQYVITDEWPAQRYNNASYREVVIGPWTSQYFYNCGPEEIGPQVDPINTPTYVGQPVIYAWQRLNPNVKIVNVDVPNDGRLIIGSLVTDLGNDTWAYEYAVFNLNCHRGVQAFSLPGGTTSGSVSSIGFHDVAYHSGELQEGTDWTPSVSDGIVTWQTPTHAVNTNANALRWGTMYNFRFVSQNPPDQSGAGQATLGFFLPGLLETDPASVVVTGIDFASTGPTCPSDFNGIGGVSLQDIFDYLNAWLAGDPAADFNHRNGVTVQDIFDFLTAWLGGC